MTESGTRPARGKLVRPLTRDDWPVVEELFGGRGACGGCWCMHHRLPEGADWSSLKGDGNRRAFRRLVRAGEVGGVLCLLDGKPIGWCATGPRTEFDRLARSRSTPSVTGGRAWVVACFYVPAAWRGHGVATALLKGAVRFARESGAPALEGFPVRCAEGERYPSTFAFVGVPRLFERAGFCEVTPSGQKRPVFLKRLRRPRA